MIAPSLLIAAFVSTNTLFLFPCHDWHFVITLQNLDMEVSGSNNCQDDQSELNSVMRGGEVGSLTYRPNVYFTRSRSFDFFQ